MYHIADLYNGLIKKPIPTDCGVVCEELDSSVALINRELSETGSLYSFTLVLSGRIVVRCGDTEIMLEKNDLFIMTPGVMIYTLEVSSDYSSLCIMAEESVTYEIPYSRNIVSASYYPVVAGCGNKLSLAAEDAERLTKWMIDLNLFTHGNHIYKRECIYSLFSLFVLDLLDIERRHNCVNDGNGNTFDLFFRFLRLLTENFKLHHDLTFYADRLSVTSIYLSRIVKYLSGQTVKCHVDRLLSMEAAYLLVKTDLSISRIAKELNFSNSVSFCKFFTRQKGVSPREYRNTRSGSSGRRSEEIP